MLLARITTPNYFLILPHKSWLWYFSQIITNCKKKPSPSAYKDQVGYLTQWDWSSSFLVSNMVISFTNLTMLKLRKIVQNHKLKIEIISFDIEILLKSSRSIVLVKRSTCTHAVCFTKQLCNYKCQTITDKIKLTQFTLLFNLNLQRVSYQIPFIINFLINR